MISSSSESKQSWSVIVSCKAVGCSKIIRCHLVTSWKCFYVCLDLGNKIHVQTYLSFFTASKIRENVELITNATGKTLASLCRRYDRVLFMTAGPTKLYISNFTSVILFMQCIIIDQPSVKKMAKH